MCSSIRHCWPTSVFLINSQRTKIKYCHQFLLFLFQHFGRCGNRLSSWAHCMQISEIFPFIRRICSQTQNRSHMFKAIFSGQNEKNGKNRQILIWKVIIIAYWSFKYWFPSNEEFYTWPAYTDFFFSFPYLVGSLRSRDSIFGDRTFNLDQHCIWFPCSCLAPSAYPSNDTTLESQTIFIPNMSHYRNLREIFVANFCTDLRFICCAILYLAAYPWVTVIYKAYLSPGTRPS